MIYFYQAVISVRDPQLKQDRTDKNFFFFFIQITNTNRTYIRTNFVSKYRSSCYNLFSSIYNLKFYYNT